MKVLGLVSYNILPAKTGGQKDIALFYKYFSRHTSLVCVTTRSNDPGAAEGYEVLNIIADGLSRYANPLHYFTIRSIIRERGITHLELEHPYWGWLAVWLQRTTGVKLIVHSHNIEGTRWKTLGKWWWKGLWQYEKWVHRQAEYNFFKQDEDRLYALRHFKLAPDRCLTTTYGIEWNTPPAAVERGQARQYLLQQHDIPAHHRLLLFNGSFNYLPNLNGLRHIIETINPALQRMTGFSYTILICGKDIPADLAGGAYPAMVFAGFVPDVDVYFKGCDVFLNPVVEGGGIKTKLVEALGHGMNAVSTFNGAIGVDPALCNGKLTITDDRLGGFPEAVVMAAGYDAETPPAYFSHFYWGAIAHKAARFIDGR
ncbi:glycosyltransferase [Paraflavitalea pollutisoli]|uniref:glycosyltransferase n=1 Tax=Paraflavitalea pollutisoli TaxID=3034143 RepID=UPI0023EC7BCF|nr:glycosyltransferase [Paraflavitalea sp. H1-2-19X]